MAIRAEREGFFTVVVDKLEPTVHGAGRKECQAQGENPHVGAGPSQVLGQYS